MRTVASLNHHKILLQFGLTSLLLLLFAICKASDPQEARPIRIGIFTDCQYCNCPVSGVRYYSQSLAKLDSCIGVFNTLPLDAVFHLGDMIDHDYGNYDSILPRFTRFRAPLYLVLGNHDYMIKPQYKSALKSHLGMKEGYYKVDLGNWRLIVLNGDDLSFVAPQNKEQKKERNAMVEDLYQRFHLNGMPWNGGIGRKQMKWLELQLAESDQTYHMVIVICHFPLVSRENHNLFNNIELLDVLTHHSCVKAYFCGHHHDGNYQLRDRIHYVNFKGMVDTPVNAFSVVTLSSDSILIKGYGREPDRRLVIRQSVTDMK